MPVATFRAWFIGIIWAVLIPGLNQFFFFRYPSVTVSGVSTISTLCHNYSSHRVTSLCLVFPDRGPAAFILCRSS